MHRGEWWGDGGGSLPGQLQGQEHSPCFLTLAEWLLRGEWNLTLLTIAQVPTHRGHDCSSLLINHCKNTEVQMGR